MKKFFGFLSIAILLMAGSALASLAPTPGSSEPINCAESVELNFHYVPETGQNLRGYSIRVLATGEVTFILADIDVNVLPDGEEVWIEIIENGPNDFTVDYTVLGAVSGISGEADLFSVTFFGNGDGTATISMADVTLRDDTNQPIPVGSLGTASIEVDCTPPDTPELTTEDPFTAGLSNTIVWTDESASGASGYLAQCASDAGFTTDLQESPLVAVTSYEFGGLDSGQIYFYRVQAVDAVGNPSLWSNVESSTQDNTLPVSSVSGLPDIGNLLTFPVSYIASDDVSSVVSVDLYVNFDSGAYSNYGTFTGSPISFTATLDGTYGFYTIAIDDVGNEELIPGTLPDDETILDTTDPEGTFDINGPDTTTPSVTVNLNSAVSDLNPPLIMRFSNDNTTWPDGWVAYATDQSWVLAGGADGLRTVYAEYQDAAGNVLQLSDDIFLDSSGPDPVTDLTATVGHGKVTVTWVDPVSGDATGIEVWRGLWHNDAYASVYPEYDDHDQATIPSRPADRDAAFSSVEWNLVETVLPTVQTYADIISERGVYYYELFAVDSANNYSSPVASNDRATNYWLGDLDPAPAPDGDVDVMDMDILGDAYGTDPDDVGLYNNEVDVGPTDNTSATGIPDTDNFINFEDLMIFGMNYGVAAPLVGETSSIDIQLASLTWQQVDQQTWTLYLQQSCNSLKGLSLRADLPSGSVISLVGGELLSDQNTPVFLKNIDSHGLDVGLAVMGTEVGLTGSGELFTVTLAPDATITELELTARDFTNADLPYDLEILDEVSASPLPTAFKLAQNFPNPFNPRTKISYELPTDEAVRLSVYAVDGRRIAVLVDEVQGAGQHFAFWNGMDNHGQPVASGTYFYRITAGSFNQTHSMVLMK